MQSVQEQTVESPARQAGHLWSERPPKPRLFFAPGSREERLLIHRAKRGDRQAFDTLRQRHAHGLRAMLLRRVAESEVDDLAQETWLSAWRSLRSFSGRSQFRTWLFSIAVHKLNSYYRRGHVPPRSYDADELDAAYVDSSYENSELRAVLTQALADLAPAQREILELYYFHEFNLKEIGQMLGRNINTVKYQFYKGHAEAANRLRDTFATPLSPTGK